MNDKTKSILQKQEETILIEIINQHEVIIEACIGQIQSMTAERRQ